MKRILISKILIIVVGCSLVCGIMTSIYAWVDAYYHFASNYSCKPSGIEIWRYISYYSRCRHFPSLEFPSVVGINEIVRPYLYSVLEYSTCLFFFLFPISVLMNLWIGSIVEGKRKCVYGYSMAAFIGIISVPVLMIMDASISIGNKAIGMAFFYLIILDIILSIIAWGLAGFKFWRNKKYFLT